MATETETKELTFEELAKVARGTTLHDAYDEGVRFLVMKGGGSLCAYVGCPDTHPMADHNYGDVPLRSHGGLTFGQKGDGKSYPAGFFWYGWDYAHLGDVSFYDLREDALARDRVGKRWTVKDVVSDSWSAIYDFRHLMKLGETIAARAKGSQA